MTLDNKSKVKLILYIVFSGYTISSKYIDFGFNVTEKSNFQDLFYIFGLGIKQLPHHEVGHHLCKLGRACFMTIELKCGQ